MISLLQLEENHIGNLTERQQQNRLSIEIQRAWRRQFAHFEGRVTASEFDHAVAETEVFSSIQSWIKADNTFRSSIAKLNGTEILSDVEGLFDLGGIEEASIQSLSDRWFGFCSTLKGSELELTSFLSLTDMVPQPSVNSKPLLGARMSGISSARSVLTYEEMVSF